MNDLVDELKHVDVLAYLEHVNSDTGFVLLRHAEITDRISYHEAYEQGLSPVVSGSPLDYSLALFVPPLISGLCPWMCHPISSASLMTVPCLKAFGETGTGLFFMPSIIEKEVCEHYGVEVVGRTNKVREQFYALSLERKISDALPILSTIYNTAKTQLFAETNS